MQDSNKNTKFEIQPLDINLAKLQFNLIKRFESEVLPITEEYNSTIRDLDIFRITVECTFDDSESSNENINLIAKITDKENNEHEFIIETGDKQKILKTVKDKDFFYNLKELCLEYQEA